MFPLFVSFFIFEASIFLQSPFLLKKILGAKPVWIKKLACARYCLFIFIQSFFSVLEVIFQADWRYRLGLFKYFIGIFTTLVEIF